MPFRCIKKEVQGRDKTGSELYMEQSTREHLDHFWCPCFLSTFFRIIHRGKNKTESSFFSFLVQSRIQLRDESIFLANFNTSYSISSHCFLRSCSICSKLFSSRVWKLLTLNNLLACNHAHPCHWWRIFMFKFCKTLGTAYVYTDV